MFIKYTAGLLSLLLFSSVTLAQTRLIAITIDDLPFVGEQASLHLNMILDTLKRDQVPATGFVIAANVRPDDMEVLKKFREAGLGIGNHTWSHKNLAQLSLKNYLQDIDKADKTLAPVLSEPRYFRYPYLDTGAGEESKAIRQFLDAHQYRIAPVTVDSKDFVFNQLLLTVPESNRRAYMNVLLPCYLEFLWQQTLKVEEQSIQAQHPEQAQILLIHANLLNAYALGDIINLYQSHGYRFISLEDALKTPEERKATSMAWKDPG